MNKHQSMTVENYWQKDARIRDSQNKVMDRIRQDPEKARSTIVSTGRIDAGLTCTVTQGKFDAIMDLGPGMGGDANGPSPGFYARAAIVGCVGMGIKMMAAREGFVFDGLEVTVETDFDDAALFELSPRSAAPVETLINIVIYTQEPADEVRKLVDRALAAAPWFLALRDAQRVTPQVLLRS